jgi:L-asparaginase II
MHPIPLVRAIRSGLQESVHAGDLAVCDAEGRLVASGGDPRRPVFARSCMKPLQAAVSLSVIGDERLSPKQVAVMCASHNGERMHVRAIRSLLRRGGLGVEALRCPPAWPLDEATMARSGAKRRDRHNCSGKHAGMLLASVRAGWDTGTYWRRGHPLQRRVLRAVRGATGLERVRLGVDGCGLPVHGVALASLATIFARLARPERLEALEPFGSSAVRAMLAEPYLVGGRDRSDTAIMVESGDVVAKAGAEGLMCAADLETGLGVALKIADGSSRATAPAMISALAQLDVLTTASVRRLASHARPPLLGGGDRAGELVAEFSLALR